MSGPLPPVVERLLSTDHPDVVIRSVQPGDARRLAELLAQGTLWGGERPEDPEPYRAAIEDIAATPGNDLLVAELGGEIVGMCQLIVMRQLQHRGGRCAEIESVHVDAARRRAGIGTALVAAAVTEAVRRGCFRVQLTSHTQRKDAHRWYERLGFVPSHTGFKLPLADP